MGRNLTHARFINISYRYRGRVVRTHTQTKTSLHVINTNIKLNEEPVVNIKANKADIKKILPYSAINNKANPTLPYSILKPETNSDSPSAKSNGVRLVSAKEIINQSPNKGVKSNTLNQYEFSATKTPNLKVSPLISKTKIINAKLTSYDTV